MGSSKSRATRGARQTEDLAPEVFNLRADRSRHCREGDSYASGVRRILPVLLVACGGAGAKEPAIAAPEGISIAIYTSAEKSYGVVDDRRYIEVAGETVLLDRIDPAAALQSLVIEPLGADAIRVVSCVRERIDETADGLASLAGARDERPKRIIVLHDPHDFSSADRFHFEDTKQMEPAVLPGASVLSPLVRCRVKAREGKHLVRVMHVSSNLTFQTQHELTMTTADRVTIATRFAIVTPRWRERAQVTLFEGAPGELVPPRELARGPMVLDGSVAILGGEPREYAARLRSIYEGVKLDDPDDDIKPNDIVWGRASRRHVWTWIELADAVTLPAGAVHAHVELAGIARDVRIDAELRGSTGNLPRWPLWIDDELIGTRSRLIDSADGVAIVDNVTLAVSNMGKEPREVWVEERLRPSKRRTLAHSWPAPPQLGKDRARAKVTIAPGKTERLGFKIAYEF
jgi:hypothetical protein